MAWFAGMPGLSPSGVGQHARGVENIQPLCFPWPHWNHWPQRHWKRSRSYSRPYTSSSPFHGTFEARHGMIHSEPDFLLRHRCAGPLYVRRRWQRIFQPFQFARQPAQTNRTALERIFQVSPMPPHGISPAAIGLPWDREPDNGVYPPRWSHGNVPSHPGGLDNRWCDRNLLLPHCVQNKLLERYSPSRQVFSLRFDPGCRDELHCIRNTMNHQCTLGQGGTLQRCQQSAVQPNIFKRQIDTIKNEGERCLPILRGAVNAGLRWCAHRLHKAGRAGWFHRHQNAVARSF